MYKHRFSALSTTQWLEKVLLNCVKTLTINNFVLEIQVEFGFLKEKRRKLDLQTIVKNFCLFGDKTFTAGIT